MLFNTYVFIFAFWPISVGIYFLLNRLRYVTAAKLSLVVASLFFYSWWNISYLPLIIGSIGFNYIVGRLLQAAVHGVQKKGILRSPKSILIIGLVGNILLLGYYKYSDFFLSNLSDITGHTFPLLHLVLPLGISFFTFTQIAYLVDAYRGKTREYNLMSYILFVTFYPHLIAGPILHHSEMMPQFDRLRNKHWNWNNAAKGVCIFVIGLFKKVVIADTFAQYANDGFLSAHQFIDTWVATLSYTLQLYFDFSGYTDMAIGAALLFNIVLPQNFNSPYKALNIQDFWRRWHMTLSRFLRDYIYIPLGGNRRGEFIAMRNIIITFLIGGLWHGAGWTFILWGFLHGAGQAVHRMWMKVGKPMPKWLAWLITFLFINIAWVFFRADNVPQAFRLLKGMAGLNGFDMGSIKALAPAGLFILIILPIVLFASNSSERVTAFRPTKKKALFMAAIFVVSLLYFNRITEFLYFNF
ncbi:MBOAT family O-acyltransferase [Paenibacillus segetis]|uniref:Peptidoglycan O-acetyltransferase n=1 Tax=Paenibacillus segetis TaxID=1325360 RepID=A0ABQ1YTL6_9BACL|nr:peptidoglycan O-acetyltransferase [Paenibacillus segetis]